MATIMRKEGGWIWFLNRETKINLESIKGKYLFFSKDKKLLIELAKKLLKQYGLPEAKVPLNDAPVGEDFVLCIYDKTPRLKYELAKYGDNKTIHYRYWKSDKDTLKGKYSEKFIKALKDKGYETIER